MTDRQRQTIRIALLLLILSVSVLLFLNGERGPDAAYGEPSRNTPSSESGGPSETTDHASSEDTRRSGETSDTSGTSESTALTSQAESSPAITETTVSEPAEATETTTTATAAPSVSSPSAEPEPPATTVHIPETAPEEAGVAYGPFEIDDISSYDIIDPVKDYAQIDEEINTDDAYRGILRVRYNGEGEYKVRIEKDDTAYNYDVNAEGRVEVFPLQMGSGDYRAMILKRIEGDRFSVIKSKRFTVEISDSNLVYLNAVQNIYWLPQMEPVSYARGPLIREILKGGGIPGKDLDIESFKALWSYIIANISYDREKYSNLGNMMGYIPDIRSTFTDRKGICYDYASLMAGLLRSYGLPVRMVMGYCPAYYGDGYHAWNEVYIDGRWITVDATYDAAFFQAGYKVAFEKEASLYKGGKKY